MINQYVFSVPVGIAEETIYWFMHGKKWTFPQHYNCRCTSILIEGEHVMAVQTYSIEIFTGKRCENNAYGVEPFQIKTKIDELLNQIPVSAMFSDEGLDIQVRKEN